MVVPITYIILFLRLNFNIFIYSADIILFFTHGFNDFIENFTCHFILQHFFVVFLHSVFVKDGNNIRVGSKACVRCFYVVDYYEVKVFGFKLSFSVFNDIFSFGGKSCKDFIPLMLSYVFKYVGISFKFDVEIPVFFFILLSATDIGL